MDRRIHIVHTASTDPVSAVSRSTSEHSPPFLHRYLHAQRRFESYLSSSSSSRKTKSSFNLASLMDHLLILLIHQRLIFQALFSVVLIFWVLSPMGVESSPVLIVSGAALCAHVLLYTVIHWNRWDKDWLNLLCAWIVPLTMVLVCLADSRGVLNVWLAWFFRGDITADHILQLQKHVQGNADPETETKQYMIHFDYIAVRFYTLLFVYVLSNLLVSCAKPASIAARQSRQQRGNAIVKPVLYVFGAKDTQWKSNHGHLGALSDTFHVFIFCYILYMTHGFGSVEVANIMSLSNLHAVSIFGHSAASSTLLFHPVFNIVFLVIVSALILFVALATGFLIDLLFTGHSDKLLQCPGCSLNIQAAYVTVANLIALVAGVGIRSVSFLFITPRGLAAVVLVVPLTWMILTLVSHAMLRMRTWMLEGVIKGSPGAINAAAMCNLGPIVFGAIVLLLLTGSI